MHAPFYLIFSFIICTSILDTIRELFVKSAINDLEPPNYHIRTIFLFLKNLMVVPRVWLGLGCSIVSLFIWLFVLAKTDLHIAFSLDSMHYLFIAFASQLILKEKVGFLRWIGTLFIVAGIVLVSLK